MERRKDKVYGEEAGLEKTVAMRAQKRALNGKRMASGSKKVRLHNTKVGRSWFHPVGYSHRAPREGACQSRGAPLLI